MLHHENAYSVCFFVPENNFFLIPLKVTNFLLFFLLYRVKERLESLTTSLMAWKQFESGLNEFNEALGKDTGALERLTGALEMGADDNLAHDVKEVAKRLSENQNAIASIASAQQVIPFFPFFSF